MRRSSIDRIIHPGYVTYGKNFFIFCRSGPRQTFQKGPIEPVAGWRPPLSPSVDHLSFSAPSFSQVRDPSLLLLLFPGISGCPPSLCYVRIDLLSVARINRPVFCLPISGRITRTGVDHNLITKWVSI
jgi:hypothetical protein